MNLIIGGGVHEHGRNCFYIRSDINYIVDCGVMRGADYPFPHLSRSDISSAEYLFLTHSHEDHTGAFDWLTGHGFRGTVIGSEETLKQISGYENCVTLSKNSSRLNLGELTVRYGRSGHCVGSLWFDIRTKSSKVLFSGDYCENSCFNVDKIRGIEADIAVIDCAFGNFYYVRAAQEKQILDFAQNVLKTGNLLLPVPRNGRAVDLISLFSMIDCNISIDEKLYNFFSDLPADSYWVNKSVIKKINENLYRDCLNYKRTAFFLADAQLFSDEGRRAAESVLASGGSVLFTGHADKGGEAEKLISRGTGKFIPYNAHMCKLDADRLASENKFKKVVYFHS